MDEAELQRIYDRRIKRFQELVAMNAPKEIVAREALLVASVVLSKDQSSHGLVTYILTEFGNKEVN